MKVKLIASRANPLEKKFNTDLLRKIEAIGAEAKLGGEPAGENAAVVVLDGRPLPQQAGQELEAFAKFAADSRAKPKPIIVGYKTGFEADTGIADFAHIADDEYGLIWCLKDYLYIKNKVKRNDI